MVSTNPREPLLAIIGATGTGKSKLAVDLATRFNGEIINGDAMQMYRGLPIITNKIPEHERNGIPHHLLNFIGLDEQPWTVSNFVKEAQRLIREIRSRDRLPILVGGTHYYTQALLFKNSLVATRFDGEDVEDNKATEWPILSAPTSEIYAKLEEVDPKMAQRWHPMDRRKIQRSLGIWLQTGKPASEVYHEQQGQRGGSHNGDCHSGGVATELTDTADALDNLRYPSLVLWLHAQNEILKQRLDARVGIMVSNGLLQEATAMMDLEKEERAKGLSLDTSKGIWVSIGFKEMVPYIRAMNSGETKLQDLSCLRNECIEAVRASTRQYAKQQARWIRNTLANALTKSSALDRLFLLDCTDLERWEDMVTEPAVRSVEAFLKDRQLPDPKSLSALANITFASIGRNSLKHDFSARECKVCSKVLMSEAELDRHIRSRGHQKVLQSARRRAENETRRLAAQARRDAESNTAYENTDCPVSHTSSSSYRYSGSHNDSPDQRQDEFDVESTGTK